MKKLLLLILLIPLFGFGWFEAQQGIIALRNTTAADVTAPEVSSTTIAADGETVTIVFTESVVTTGYDNGDFDLDCSSSGSNIALNSISGSGDTRQFTAASAIYESDTCNLDYTGGGDEIEDASGNDLAGFSDESVTNNSEVSAYSGSIDFWWDCENTTPGFDNGSGALTPSSGAITISATAVKNGTYGILTTDDYDYYSLAPSDRINHNAFRVGFWIKAPSGYSADWIVPFYLAYDGDNYVFWHTDGDGDVNVQFAYSGTSRWVYTTTSPLTDNTWQFIEIIIDTATDLIAIKVDGSQEYSSTANAINSFASAPVDFFIGNFGDYASPIYIDTVIITSDITEDLYEISDETSYPY